MPADDQNQPNEPQRSRITQPGYRKGMLPGNFGKRYPAETLSREEIERLLDTCKGDSNRDRRDRALIALLWRTGLRISEALALYQQDLHLSTGIIRVRRGRNKRSRTIAMDEGGRAQLLPWLERRTEEGLGDKSPVFCVYSKVPTSARHHRCRAARHTWSRQDSDLADRVPPRSRACPP
jgi:site-specific recombinase XerD